VSLHGQAFGQLPTQPPDPWKLLAAGNAREAAELFQLALTRNPQNARLHLGAGTAAYLERRDTDAEASLERALQLEPKLTPASELLGVVRYRRGDLFGAIRAYDTLPPASISEGTRDRLERWRRELELANRMELVVGNGVTVSFEGVADAALAARAVESIERAADRIGQALSAYPLEPVRVVLYTGEQFRDITRAPAWAGGAYDGTIRVPMRGALAEEKELDRVLAHEYTHALVHSLAPRGVPKWLDEGLATALEHETTESATAESAARDATPESTTPAADGTTAVEQGKTRQLMPIRELQASFGRFTGAQAQVAYNTSGLIMRRLLDEEGGLAVINLIKDLDGGADVATAFERRMHRSLADFEASLQQ
jgi:hypothetical protein